MRRWQTIPVCGTLCLIVALQSPSSFGHSATDYYNQTWFDTSVKWAFTVGVPASGGFRARVRDGADAWNSLPPAQHFYEVGEVPSYPPYTPCSNLSYQENAIHYYNMVESLGRTYQCFAGNEMTKFQLAIDVRDNWYLGEPTPPPASDSDLQSTATHEFGHAGGFRGPFSEGHFKGSGELCTLTPYHTMCPFQGPGEGWFRSLEEHDRHTFDDAY
ncbi:hypothetical protein BH20ACT24_BH20ACT24_21820 [soil metagenome]